MNKWAQIIGTKIVGQVVSKRQLNGQTVLGLDLSGECDIWYVNASEAQPLTFYPFEIQGKA